MRIPFTNYHVRKFTEIKNDSVKDEKAYWGSRYSTNKRKTPFKNQILTTIASEFAKTKFVVANEKLNGNIDQDINNLITLRPNDQLSAFDFYFTLAYQLYEHGNAIAVPLYGKNDSDEYTIKSIEIKNMSDYNLGFGYAKKADDIYLVVQDKRTMRKQYIPYDDIIHLRLNANDYFFGDKNENLNPAYAYSNVIDEALADYSANIGSKVTGVLKLGSQSGSSFGGKTQLSEPQKERRLNAVIARIEKFKDGILPIDETEEFQVLNKPWNKISKDEMDNLLSTMYSLYGINLKVINGTASIEEMDHFVSKTIKPLIKKLEQEMTYKLLSKNKRTRGMKIKGIMNPFDYIPISRLGDVAYKMSHLLTVNQIRDGIYLEPVEDGDTLMTNLNFMKGGDDNGVK